MNIICHFFGHKKNEDVYSEPATFRNKKGDIVKVARLFTVCPRCGKRISLKQAITVGKEEHE